MFSVRKSFAVAAFSGAALASGAMIASLGGTSASAAQSDTTAAPAQTDQATTDSAADQSLQPPQGAHQGPQGPHTNAAGDAEVELTGDDAAKATEAALAAVPDATVEQVSTDVDGDAYEAHMLKSDGTRVTVKLDENFAVVTIEEGPGMGGHGGPHTNAAGEAEVVLTGDDATKATDAALAAVPDATVERVETDVDGDAYEAHVVKTDGTRVTVKLDENFALVTIEDGPDMGGPGGHGKGPRPADAPADPAADPAAGTTDTTVAG